MLALKAAERQIRPAELVERMIIGGETPLKVWREHRKMTVAALSATAGVSGSYIS